MIDEQIVAKVPVRQIAVRFSVGRQSIARHAQHRDRALECAAERISERAAEAEKALKAEIVEYPHSAVTTAALVKQDQQLKSTSEDAQKLLKSLLRDRIPLSHLVERLAEGVDARKFRFFSVDGHCTDVKATPDFAERRAYIELVSRLGGYYVEKPSSPQGFDLDLRPLEELMDDARRLTDELATEIARGQFESASYREGAIECKPED